MQRKTAAKQRSRKRPRSADVQIVARATLPTRFGPFTILGVRGEGANEEAAVLLRGKVDGKRAPLVRVHSQCLTGDVFASQRCDCRDQLELALKEISEAPSGLLLTFRRKAAGLA